jgi:hypothetical protein
LHRYLQKAPNSDKRPAHHNALLTDLQDQVLYEQILRLIRWNLFPGYDVIAYYANRLLRGSFNPSLSDQTEPPTVGKSWVGRWLKRHPELDTDWAKPKDNKRVVVEDKDDIQAFFQEFESVVADYGIANDNIYNVDETSYLIGMSQQRKVVKLSKMKALRIRCLNNRENCTVIECIRATGQALLCTVILKGKLICTNFVSNLPDNYTLRVSDSGWTNDKIGLY